MTSILQGLKEAKTGSSMFVALEDGGEIIGVFRGKPKVYYQVFGEPKEYEEPAEGRTMRFKINFVVPEGTGHTAKILNSGARLSKKLLAVEAEYGLDVLYKIKRTGVLKKTSYDILFKGELNKAQLEAVNKVKLNPLERVERPNV